MKVCDLVKMLNLTVFCGEEGLDTEITGGYTSDLLSDVMGHIEEGMLWVTMQTHQNVLAVATLKDASAVLIVNGTSPDDETLQKGRAEAVQGCQAIVTPIDIAGERLGTLFIYKQDKTYSIDDIILSEYGIY